MNKRLTVIDKDYTQWVAGLSARYRQSQIKAAVKVNREMLRFYWELGRDIEEMHVEERWGDRVIKNLSTDLQRQIPNASGLSRSNIYYAKKFYLLYAPYLNVVPQVAGQLEDKEMPQPVAQSSEIVPQLAGQLEEMLFSIPWGHYRCLMDRYGKEPAKALFYARKTLEEGWSRNMLLNFMDTGLYERRMAYASVIGLEIWHSCVPNLTDTRPLPILQTRLRNLRMKVIDEPCVQKMHICPGNSATGGCSMPHFIAGHVDSGATHAENAQIWTKMINKRNA